MPVKDTMLLSEVKEVQWFSDLKEENVFSKLNISFGFEGVGKESFPCQSLKQVHSADIFESASGEEGDGLYSRKAGEILGIKTADCLPVLIAAKNARTVMALHAGWRGLNLGILAKGVDRMKEMEPGKELFSCIGPAICPYHYEVGPEIMDLVKLAPMGFDGEDLALCFSPGLRDRWQFDLQCAGVLALLKSGVPSKNISVFRSCTYCFEKKWHSYRREGPQKKSFPLRNWSWIQVPS